MLRMGKIYVFMNIEQLVPFIHFFNLGASVFKSVYYYSSLEV